MTIDKPNRLDSVRRAWTGGDIPPVNFRRTNACYRAIVSLFFQEQLADCGGLDFWKCTGTGSMERARIFWNRAKLDGWRTYTETYGKAGRALRYKGKA